MGYGPRPVWPSKGDVFVSLRVVCVLVRGCGAAFIGVVSCLSLPYVKSLTRTGCVCV